MGPFPSWEITEKRLVDGDIGLLHDPDGDGMIAFAVIQESGWSGVDRIVGFSGVRRFGLKLIQPFRRNQFQVVIRRLLGSAVAVELFERKGRFANVDNGERKSA